MHHTLQAREASGDYRMSPLRQKSANTSSEITSQLDGAGGASSLSNIAPEVDFPPPSGLASAQNQRQSLNNDLTQEIVYSMHAPQVEPASSHDFKNFFASSQLMMPGEGALEQHALSANQNLEGSDDKSFENGDDSVGEEFSVVVQGVENLPTSQPCHQQSLKKNSGQHFNNAKTHVRIGGADQPALPMTGSSGNERNLGRGSAAGLERQKVRVRGSVVRNNFQQSLQAMNSYPFRNQVKNDRQPYLMKLPQGNSIPPAPHRASHNGRQGGQLATTLKQPVNIRALIGGSEIGDSLWKSSQQHQESPMMLDRRPLSATQSLSNRFKNGVPVKQSTMLNNTNKHLMQHIHSSMVEQYMGFAAMGPKISAEKYASNNESTCKHAGKMLERSQSPSDDGIDGLPQVVEFRVEVGGAAKNTAAVKGSDKWLHEPFRLQSQNKPHTQDHLQQHLSKGQIASREGSPLPAAAAADIGANHTNDSFGSCSLDRHDDGASHNICASQITKLQTIKTISKQSIVKAARADEKRRQETNKICQAMPNSGDHSFNFAASEVQAKDMNIAKAVLHNRRNHIDQNPQLTELRMSQMNLKFVSINLFSKNLVNVDLSENKIRSLPEEIATITTLQSLKIDHNMIESLPKDLWKLQKLKKLVAQNNWIKALPPNFEWLPNLEQLTISDNQLRSLPEKIGLLSTLQKLHLHENQLSSLPRELSKLVNLADFSLEWFMYTKPANARVQKNPEVIKSVRDFCQNFHFNPTNSISIGYAAMTGAQMPNSVAGLYGGAGHRPMQHSIQCESNSLELRHLALPGVSGNSTGFTQSKYVTFSDFIVQYHKISHSDLSQINKIEFTMKKRSLVHQICFNVHTHLLKSLLNIANEGNGGAKGNSSPAQRSETSPDAINRNRERVRPSHGVGSGLLQGQKSSTDLFENTAIEDLTRVVPETAESALAKVINLHKKDTQGVVPLCLLVMNMTPVERKSTFDIPELRGSLSPKAGDKDLAKTAANFFSQDNNQEKVKFLNKRRKEIMRLLLECKDENGESLVDINNQGRRPNKGKSQASTILITTKEQRDYSPVGGGNTAGNQQQHPVLYWTVFKYQFKLAIELIEHYGADPTVLNSNNSNLLHILFANFNHDLQYATQLADLLIARKVNLNLIDKDGKSPVLVAIKKSQIEALQFAHMHNIMRQATLLQDPSYTKASQLIRKSVSRLELFDFRMLGRCRTTPLHYVIKKSNYESFLYLINHQLCDCLARDVDQMTPRLTSLINSAFYRILLKEEKRQVRNQIALLELQLLQKKPSKSQEQQTVQDRSLLCHMLAQSAVLIDARAQDMVPPLKVLANMAAKDDKSPLEVMKKDGSESSIPVMLETSSNFVLCQSTRFNELDSAKARLVTMKNQQKTERSQIQQSDSQHIPLSAVTGKQRHATSTMIGIDELSSIGSPKIRAQKAPPVQRITLHKMHHQYHQSSHKGSQVHMRSQQHRQKSSNDYLKVEPTFSGVSKGFYSSHFETYMDTDTKRNLDASAQFDRINVVRHYVISRRSIHRAEDCVIETTETFHQEELQSGLGGGRSNYETLGLEVQVQRPNRSSTLRLSDRETLDFTLGARNQKELNILRHVAQRMKHANSPELCSSPEKDSVLSNERSGAQFDDQHSPTQVPPTVQSTSRKLPVFSQEESTTMIFPNTDEAVTTRVLNLDSSRTISQQKYIPGMENQSTKFRQFNMFKGLKNRNNLSPGATRDSEALPAHMRMYEQRGTEMRPLTLKKPSNESPVHKMRRQDSDVSIPPSFQVGEDTLLMHTADRLRQVQSNMIMQTQVKSSQRKRTVAEDDELGQTIRCLQEDEVLQETMPNRTIDGASMSANTIDVSQINNNLFGYAQSNEEELQQMIYETERVLEGPLRPLNNSPPRDYRQAIVEVSREATQEDFGITSPHFNQDVFQFNEDEKQGSQGVLRFDNVDNQVFQQPQAEGVAALLERVQSTTSLTSLGHHISNQSAVDQIQYDPTKSSISGITGQSPIGEAPAQSAKEPQPVSQQTSQSNNIFISNMNININLNISINMPQDPASSGNSEADPQQVTQAMTSKALEQQQLSTILDEQLFSETEHKPKPSLGSKAPPHHAAARNSKLDSVITAPENAKSSALSSILESQAKQITQQQILDQINPKELVQAVSQHFQMQQLSQTSRPQLQPSQAPQSSCDLRGTHLQQENLVGTERVRDVKQHSEIHKRVQNMAVASSSSPVDDQKMFLSKKPSQNVPIERKKFQLNQAFLNRQQSMSKESSPLSRVLPTASENIETSVIGTTPAKPQFQQSALKDKQNHRFYMKLGGGGDPITLNQGIEDHNVPYSYRRERKLGSPQFQRPENKEELFAGRAAAQGQHTGDYGDLLAESEEKFSRRGQQVFGYLLTDNTQLVQGRKQGEIGGDQPSQGNAIMSASFIKSSTSQIRGESGNILHKYTLGNGKQGEQQITMPSLTQQSNFVLNTGVSDLGGQSPINIPLQLAKKCGSPVGVEREIGSRRASAGRMPLECISSAVYHSGESCRQSLPLKPLTMQSELVMRCESQLSQNLFLKQFRIISDPYEADWIKYEALYKRLAPHILINSGSSKTETDEKKEQKDSLFCLELLIEVLTAQPGAILPDLIHLMTKSNMMKARNDMIEQVSDTLQIQREQLIQTKGFLQQQKKLSHEEQTLKRAGFLASADLAPYSSFCLSMAFMESQNAKCIHQVYKKIQLNKFPTISKNLGLFLKNKRQTEKSNFNIGSRDETRRTQNIPQSLQKRVKISMIAKPYAIEEPLNETVFTPRDNMNSYRPAMIQPNPNQSIPRHPTKLASQMRQLNAVSMASRPGLHSKLQTRISESVIPLETNSSGKRSNVKVNQTKSHRCSIDAAAINISREQPSKIQPIRNIMSPKGFFPTSNN